MDRRDPTDLPHDWESQVARAYATFGVDPLDSGADQFAFGFHLDVDFLRRKAKDQLRDALGRWRDERGRLDTGDDRDDGIDPLRVPPANPPTLVARQPGQWVAPPMPRTPEGEPIPDVYVDYPRDANGRPIMHAGTMADLAEVNGFPVGHDLHEDLLDSVDDAGNPVKVLSEEGELEHRKIVGEMLDGVESRDPENPEQIFLGGGSGAGKGTVTPTLEGYPKVRELKDYKKKPAGTAALIDSDAAKMRSKHWGEPNLETTASYTHTTSSLIAELALAEAQRRRLDVVVDGTGNGKATKMQAKVDKAKELGYKTKGIYVTVPTEEGVLRAISRALSSGRLVSPTMVADIHRKVSAVYPALEGMFDNVSLWDANVPRGAPAKPISANGRLLDKMNPDAAAARDAFLAKGHEEMLEVLQNSLAQAKTRKWEDVTNKATKATYTAREVQEYAIRILNQQIQAVEEKRKKDGLTSAAAPEGGEDFTVEDMNRVLLYAVTDTPLPEMWAAIPEAELFYERMRRFFELSREDPKTAGMFTFDTASEFPE